MPTKVPLFERLSTLPDLERDRQLAAIWAGFKGSDAYEALVDMLRRLHKPAFDLLLGSETPAERRAYAAGVAYVCDLLMVTLQTVTNLDLSSFLQDPSTEKEEAQDFVPPEDVPY